MPSFDAFVRDLHALCRKHDFTLRGPIEYAYRGRTLRVNHWVRETSE